MRHRKKSYKFNRTSTHRKSMFQNMVIALINYHVIKTTVPKAKILRQIIEPMITRGKLDNLSNRRLIFSRIRNNDAVVKLFTKISLHFLNRPGGYTRVLKCGFRKGDNAPMAYIEFVDRSKFFELESSINGK